MDLGLVALLPRDVAHVTGRVSEDRQEELRTLIGETASIVAWQTPAVALVGFVVWWLIPGDWSPLRWPLAMVVLAFVVTFPLRIFPAVLQGLQDLTFLGGTQLGAWLIGTVFTIALVQAGFGLYSLAAGWVCTQILFTFTAWHRLRQRSDAQVVYLPRMSMSRARSLLGRGTWISVSQIAQVLLNGTELFVIGKLMGPAAVVPYACTAKLVTLLGNQPQLFMQMAVPALSELRAVSRERLFQVSTSMSQAMLIGSGAIACLVLTINRPFVTWWVGSDRFLGMGLTVLLLISMMLRHWNLAVGYTLFCFGRERRLAITGVADGVVTVVSMILLIPQLGAYGAVIGSLSGICGISLPNNLRALAREEGVSLSAAVEPLRSWFVRLALAAGLLTVAVSAWVAEGFWAIVIIGTLVGGSYFVLMFPVLCAPPLGSVLVPRLRGWVAFVPHRFRRLANQPTP
jgi:O-antigen/teichoic acid export membrane protein